MKCKHCHLQHRDIEYGRLACVSFNDAIASMSPSPPPPQLTHPPRLMCDPEYIEIPEHFETVEPEPSVRTEKPFKGILEGIKKEQTTPGLVFTDQLSVTMDKQLGTDDDIARIARHDQDGGTDKLLRSLMKNRHGSPFEFGYICFKCEIPLFVIQQMLRHRIGVSYSQWSLRWDQAVPRIYMPSIMRPFLPLDRKQSNVRYNKYMGHTTEEYNRCTSMMMSSFNHSFNYYHMLLEMGVAQELARIVLPAAQMSIIHVSFNPRSLMHFLSLRIDTPENRYPSHAQYEVDRVARTFSDAFKLYWPKTYAAFTENGRVAP
jgi:thymidylate synthase (FAD)